MLRQVLFLPASGSILSCSLDLYIIFITFRWSRLLLDDRHCTSSCHCMSKTNKALACIHRRKGIKKETKKSFHNSNGSGLAASKLFYGSSSRSSFFNIGPVLCLDFSDFLSVLVVSCNHEWFTASYTYMSKRASDRSAFPTTRLDFKTTIQREK